jgi:hypothetical protein
MALVAFTGATSATTLNANFDDATTRIDATMVAGRVDYPIHVRKGTLAVADDVSLRSVAWTAADDSEVRVLRVLATHTTTGIDVTATLEQADGDTAFMMDAAVTVSVACINGTAQASLDLRTTTGRRIMLLRGVRYRLTVSAAGGTVNVGQATVLLRTRRRTR